MKCGVMKENTNLDLSDALMYTLEAITMTEAGRKEDKWLEQILVT